MSIRVNAFLLSVVMLGAVSAGAQRRYTEDFRPFGAGFFEIGGMRSDFDDLSRTLVANGFAGPKKHALTLGGGGYVLHHRFLIGGEGHASFWEAQSTAAGRETDLTAGYGMLNVGYAVVRTERWNIYPLGGVGGGAVQLALQDRNGVGIGPDVNEPTFDEVLRDPGNRSTLTRVGVVTSVGLGIDFISRSARAGSTGGFLVGVRAGYLFNPASGSWRLYDNRVIGGPDATLAGPFVKVSFGGGGSKRS